MRNLTKEYELFINSVNEFINNENNCRYDFNILNNLKKMF